MQLHIREPSAYATIATNIANIVHRRAAPALSIRTAYLRTHGKVQEVCVAPRL